MEHISVYTQARTVYLDPSFSMANRGMMDRARIALVCCAPQFENPSLFPSLIQFKNVLWIVSFA